MGTIDLLFDFDIIKWTYILFVIMSAFAAICGIVSKFCDYIGKPIKWFHRNNKDHELLLQTAQCLSTLQEKQKNDINQLDSRDDRIQKELSELSEKVDNISSVLNEMKEKDNITEVKKLKEKLVGYYNKYKNSDGWTDVERDVFWDLFDDYEKRGGDGYIHSIVEPVMREMKVIDL